MIDNHRVYTSRDEVLSRDPHSSPGVILDYLVIEESRSGRGRLFGWRNVYDARLSTNSSVLNWAVYRRPSFKHRLVDGLRSVKHALLRTFQRPVPDNPILELQPAALSEMDC